MIVTMMTMIRITNMDFCYYSYVPVLLLSSWVDLA